MTKRKRHSPARPDRKKTQASKRSKTKSKSDRRDAARSPLTGRPIRGKSTIIEIGNDQVDMGAVYERAGLWLNERWQGMVNAVCLAADLQKPRPVGQGEAVRATMRLRGQYEQTKQAVTGMFGHYSEFGVRGMRTELFADGSKPFNAMVHEFEREWLIRFFQPQADTAKVMLRGILIASSRTDKAKDEAHELLNRLQKSTLFPDHRDAMNLLDEIATFLTSYLPSEDSEMLSEAMSIKTLRTYFRVNRNKMSQMLQQMEGVQRFGGLFRVPICQLPPKYHVDQGLMKPE